MSFAGSIRSGLRSISVGVRHSAPAGRRYAAVRHVVQSYHSPPSISRGGGVSHSVRSGNRAINRAVGNATGRSPQKVRQIQQQAQNRQRIALNLLNSTSSSVAKTANQTSRAFTPKVSKSTYLSAAKGLTAGVKAEQSSQQKVRAAKSIQTRFPSQEKVTGGGGPAGTRTQSGHIVKLKPATALSPAGKAVVHAAGTVVHALVHGDPSKNYTPTLNQAIDRGAKVYAASQKRYPLVPNKKGHTSALLAPSVALANGPSPEALKIAANVGKDAINTPAQAVTTAVQTGSAVAKAATGHPKELQQLGNSLANDTFTGNVIQGNFKKAAHIAETHPLNSALEVSGAKAVIGRGSGAVLRHSPSKALRKVASVERKPKVVPGTKLVEKRSYSPDLINKGVQKTAEALRKEAKKPPKTASTHQIRRRVNEHVSMAENIRRANRTKTIRKTGKVTVRTKKGGTAQVLHSQGIVKASRQSLQSYHAHLQHQYDHANLGPAQKAANKLLRNQIKTVLSAKKVDYGKVEQAAQRYQEVISPLTRKMVKAGIIENDHAALTPYAVREMGATPSKTSLPHVPDGAGGSRALTPDEIKQHMATNPGAVKQPAFVTQAPNMRGAKNFYISHNQPRGVGVPHRTGIATVQGTFDAHPAVLTETAARARGLVDAHENFRRFVQEFGHRVSQSAKDRTGQGGVWTFKSKKAAQRAMDHLHLDEHGNPIPDAVQWRAIRISPFKGNAQTKNLLDEISSEGQSSHHHMTEALTGALEGKGGQGKWALVPDAAADQMAKHIRVNGPGAMGKSVQVVNSAFRRTVLATNPRWLAGNTGEAALRTGLMRAGPRSYVTMRKVLKALPPEERATMDSRAFAGGHYSFAERQHLHRSAEQFRDTRMEPVAKALGTFWRAPGPKQLGDVWHAWTTSVFGANSLVERQFQVAMGGKYVRSQLMEPGTLKLGKKAIQQAAEGLKNTNEQVALARAVDRAYGRYDKFSPELRTAIAYYTPFIPWSLNAVKFVYDVLPRDHPVLTGLLAAATTANAKWRQDQGLDKFMAGRVPDFLQGSIPTSHGGHLRVNRYTPFGLFSDPLGGFAQSVLPQADSVLQGLQGKDWLGRTQYDNNGQPLNEFGKAKLAATGLFEATVPIFGLAGQIQQKGAARALNPFAVTPAASAKGSKRGVLHGPRDKSPSGYADYFAGHVYDTAKGVQYPHNSTKPGTFGQPPSRAPRGSGSSTGTGPSAPSKGPLTGPGGKLFFAPKKGGPLVASAAPVGEGEGVAHVNLSKLANQTASSTARIGNTVGKLAQPPSGVPNVANVFKARITPPNVAMSKSVSQAAGRVLKIAMSLPGNKAYNLTIDRTVARENPVFRRDVTVLWNHLRQTTALPPWARNLKNPTIKIIPPTLWTQSTLNQKPGSLPFGQVSPSVSSLLGSKSFGAFPFAALTDEKTRTIYFTPNAVAGAVEPYTVGVDATGGTKQGARFFKTHVPLHEFAHTIQKPGLSRALSEGGADAFATVAQKALGVHAPTTKQYAGFAKQARAKGNAFVTRGQFAQPALQQAKAAQLLDRVATGVAHTAGEAGMSLPSGAGPYVTKTKLFAHPQRPGTGKAGQTQLTAGKLAAAPHLTPGQLLHQWTTQGAKNQKGQTILHPKVAKKLIGFLHDRGFGNGQIVQHLTHQTPLKKLGQPHQLVAAAQVLKGVKAVSAAVPQNKSHYSPAEISKMAQSHGAPKWLADALGHTSVFESGGNPRATSNSAGGGSRGLLQINPAAWGAVHQHGDLYNPDYNIRSALYVLSQSGSPAWSGSGTWHDRPVAAGQFHFPPPWQQKAAVKLTAKQEQAVKIVERAHRAGQKIPKNLRHFVTQNMPAIPTGTPPSGVSTSGVPSTSSSSASSAGGAAGKAAGQVAGAGPNTATTTGGLTAEELQALQMLGFDLSGATSVGSLKLPKTSSVRVRALTKSQERSALV